MWIALDLLRGPYKASETVKATCIKQPILCDDVGKELPQPLISAARDRLVLELLNE